MLIKPGVKLRGVQAPTVVGMMVADQVYQSFAKVEMTVTSVTDGKHKVGSLHYAGLAFDARTKNLPAGVSKASLVAMLKTTLGDEWDVLLEHEGGENEHAHFEWDVPAVPAGPVIT